MPKPSYGPRTKAERKLRSTYGKKYSGPSDSNATEITVSETQNERMRRKEALRESLHTEQSGQMSSKKKKRLDKYIDSKLRKEENQELLKKLAKTQTDVSYLKSSRSLGGIARDTSSGKLSDGQVLPVEGGESSSDGSESDDEGKPERRIHANMPPPAAAKKAYEEPLRTLAVGSGLKRPLETDVFGAPVIRKRQKTKAPLEPEAEESEVSWEGFSSEDADEDANSSASRSDSTTDDEDSDSIDDDDDDEDLDSDDEEEAESLAASIFAALDQRKKQKAQEEPQKPARDVSGFKAWAAERMNEARDFTPSRPLDEIIAASKATGVDFQPRAPEQDELPPELRAPSINSARQAFAVNVTRPPEIQEARLKLPVVAEEQKIMESIHNNPITIVCGATGSGKTTQVPQFLFEAGYGDPNGPTPGMIAITQPRRVAAVTMRARVAKELGIAGNKVAYQIRYDSTVDKGTAMKFMTDGILIREIAQDFALSKYSAIVIDEAHERSVNTDILIGMLSRIVDLRDQMHKANPEKKPLKLIIMSATLMVKAFTENPNLFKRGAPPLIQSEGRQYPVTMHFARRTQRDYLEEAFKKVMRGHKKLPPGAMLVFLTGENEILSLSTKLKEALGKSSGPATVNVRLAASKVPLEAEDFDYGNKHVFTAEDGEDDYQEDEYASDDSEEDEFDVEPEGGEKRNTVNDVLILPLYSKLPTKEQLRVFEPPPENTRLIVLSTNVAETSVTIPGIRYVFDCGRSKDKKFDQSTGVQSFEIDWISKASAAQRAGRAGRTGPGHCYRFYSSAVYERDFADHTVPEILRMPVEGVVLQLKSMDLQHVANFPFPTPPDQQSILKAEKLLAYLGAIDSAGKVTENGRQLSLYPISPRYARMLAIGHQQDCMLLTIAMVAALATPELFVPENQVGGMHTNGTEISFNREDTLGSTASEEDKKAFRRVHLAFSGLDEQADAIKLLSAFGAYQVALQTENADAFCKRTFLRSKSMKEALQLFRQLLRIVADNRPGSVNPSATTIPRASPAQVNALKQFVAVGFIDQVAMRADLTASPPDLPKPKRAIEVPYVTLFPSHEGRGGTPEERVVYVHASSILAGRKVTEMPQYIIYSRLQRASASSINGAAPKVRMHPLTSVTAGQLSALAKGTPLLEWGKPIGKIESVPGSPDKRVCWVVPSLVGQKGITAWPLPARKVIQKRGPRGVWEVEMMA